MAKPMSMLDYHVRNHRFVTFVFVTPLFSLF